MQVSTGVRWSYMARHSPLTRPGSQWKVRTLNASSSNSFFLFPIMLVSLTSPVVCRCPSLCPGAAGCGNISQCSLQPHLCCCRSPRARGGAVVAGRGPGGRAQTVTLRPPRPRSHIHHNDQVDRRGPKICKSVTPCPPNRCEQQCEVLL